MGKLYRIQMRQNETSPWVDLKPLKGMYDHRNHTYAEARSIVADYKGLSGTRNFRYVVQRETPEQLLELDLQREAIRKAEKPHIAYRMVETHLGIRSQIYRIEVTIMGQEFWLKGSQTNVKIDKQIRLCYNIIKHVESGKMLNLEHWEPVKYC